MSKVAWTMLIAGQDLRGFLPNNRVERSVYGRKGGREMKKKKKKKGGTRRNRKDLPYDEELIKEMPPLMIDYSAR